MMRYFADSFDSTIFGRPVYKLQLDRTATEQKVKRAMAKSDVAIIFAFTPFAEKNIRLLESLGFGLVSIRATYELKQPKETKKNPKQNSARLVRWSTEQRELEPKSFETMASIIGSTSRYFHDTRLPRRKSLRLYTTWINNSLFHGYATEAFVLLKQNKLMGLVTLKIRDGVGSIDLIGVHSSLQGQGWGSALLSEAIAYFRKKKITKIQVITEGENVAACAFYERCGFSLVNTELVYHKHNAV